MNTQTAKELYKKAQNFIQEQKFDEALEALESSLALEKAANAFHDLGIIYHLRNNNEKAVSLLQEAANEDPQYHQAYANLSKIMFGAGNTSKAIEYTALAIQAAPENRVYMDNFIELVDGLDFKIFNAELKALILKCLGTENINHDKISRPWLSLLQRDPSFKLVYESDTPEISAPLFDHFFLVGLKRLLVADTGFELFLTKLRRVLLETGTKDYLGLIAALAEYCFQSEYIFSVSEEELKRVAGLDMNEPWQVAMRGCYEPLYTLEKAKDIADNIQGIDDLIIRQILEPLEEQSLRKKIPALSTMEDQTSRDVRAQYETFPYPRWKALSSSYKADVSFEGEINNILIAGCGTGKEALEFAKAFPKAEILAIDISLASLSYAIRKAKENSIGNVTFKQADILKLGALDRKFDLISSSGVLHHMKDPVAGWTVLMGLLKPRGYMHIALYSELARRDIVTARATIEKESYSSNAEGMRAFRENCGELFDKEALERLLSFRDFYSMSECRDLLFHVMEHRFDVEQIAAILEKFGLAFLGFTLPDHTKNLYLQENADDLSMKNLQNWSDFEERHPDSFAATYDFWCRKN